MQVKNGFGFMSKKELKNKKTLNKQGFYHKEKNPALTGLLSLKGGDAPA